MEQAMDSALLADRLLDFSARVGKVVDALPRKRLAKHIASQLVRRGTALGSHYEEGCFRAWLKCTESGKKMAE